MSVRIEPTHILYIKETERYMWICDICDEHSPFYMTRNITNIKRDLHKHSTRHIRNSGKPVRTFGKH